MIDEGIKYLVNETRHIIFYQKTIFFSLFLDSFSFLQIRAKSHILSATNMNPLGKWRNASLIFFEIYFNGFPGFQTKNPSM